MPSNQSGTYSTSAQLPVDEQLGVLMSSASIVSCSGETEECTSGLALSVASMVDPMFTVNSSVPNASEYQIIVSPDLLTTTPLPSTWAMMLPVLAGLGFIAYRQRKQSASLVTADAFQL